MEQITFELNSLILTTVAAFLLLIPMSYLLFRRLSQRETNVRNLKVGATPAVADLRRELRRAHRHSTLVSILIVEFPGFIEAARRTSLPFVEGIQRDLVNIMHARLRSEDQLCTLEVGKYLLILPGTDESGSRLVRARLKESLEAYRASQHLNQIGDTSVAEAVQVQFHRLTSRPGAYVTPEKLFQKIDSTGDRLARPIRNLSLDGLQQTGTDTN